MKTRTEFSTKCLCLLTASLLSGCASLPGDQVMNVDGRRVEVAQIDHARPVVVFENGLGAHKESWNKVFPAVAETATAFAYDRPGIGESDSTTQPRDGDTIVEELRAHLRSRNLPPPYVLVGHSLGGLYMQLYARRYPAEVAGLVLVDSTPPTLYQDSAYEKLAPWWARAITATLLFGNTKREFDAIEETGREVLAAPPPPARMPIVILTAPTKDDTPIARFVNAKRADFARFYPNAKVSEIDSGHFIQLDRPDLVITAIQEVLAKARASSPSRTSAS